MSDLAPSIPSEPTRVSVERYLGLVEAGVLGPDDRVELLEGVIVAMAPQVPPHATGVSRAYEAVRHAIGNRAHVRSQLSLVLRGSVPEPDLAVVPGSVDDYAHPTTALLVIEVADSWSWSRCPAPHSTPPRCCRAARPRCPPRAAPSRTRPPPGSVTPR